MLDAAGHGQCRFEQLDILSGKVVPTLEVIEEFNRVAHGTFRGVGRDLRLGLRLSSLHLEAGIGAPDGLDLGARIGPLPVLAPMYEAVYRSLLARALSLGLMTTQAQSERWFETFSRESAAADGHAALWPLLIGTWRRKAATT
jgi:hypothetical protein